MINVSFKDEGTVGAVCQVWRIRWLQVGVKSEQRVLRVGLLSVVKVLLELECLSYYNAMMA